MFVRNIVPACPDLNRLDYSIWAEINRRMRKQELKWAASKKESRKGFLKRLRRTAINLPSSFVSSSIGNLKKRTKLLLKARRGQFPEGGH